MARAANRVEIGAPAPQVWAAITNVEAWPQWAPQMKRLERLDAAPLRLDSRVRRSCVVYAHLGGQPALSAYAHTPGLGG